MNKVIATLIIIIGIVFLAVPLASDSYSHYLQNKTYEHAQEQVVTCRAKLALDAFEHNIMNARALINSLDTSCGFVPKYDDYSYTQTGILSLYNWIGQKVSFVPL